MGTDGYGTLLPGALYANVRDENIGDHVLVSPAGVLNIDAWNHIALTYDQASGNVRLFANGKVVASREFVSFRPRTALPLYFGFRPTGSADYYGGPPFFGKMDEWSLYSRALSSAELSAIYTAASQGKCLSPRIVTTELPEGDVKAAYSAALAAEMGTAPYTYKISLGALPAGLFLSPNGVISGKPSSFGITTFTVEVTDSLGVSGSRTFAINVPTCVSPPQSIVSWWPAEGGGVDVVGTNDLALHVGDYAPAKVGSGFALDGLSSYAVAAASPGLNVSSFSMEAWIHPSDVEAARPIFVFANPSGFAGVNLWLGTLPGALNANIRDTEFRDHVLSTASGVVGPNSWTHVVLAFDQPSGRATIYVNGSSASTAVLGIYSPATSFALYLGIIPSGSRDYRGTQPFAGILDEATLYRRALSAAEVEGLFHAGAAGKCVDQPYILEEGELSAAFGVPYSHALSAALGTAPYQFGIAGGLLPRGITLSTNGMLSGAPEQFGVFNFRVGATDANGVVAVQTLSLQVPEPAAASSSLVSWWPGSGNGKDLASTNDLILNNIGFVPGEAAKGFGFNGTNSSAVAPASPSFAQGSLTFELWVNPADTSTRRPILEFSSPDGALGVHLWLGLAANNATSAGAVYVNFRDTLGADHVMSTAPSALQANHWNHIAISYEQDTGRGAIYVNGAGFAKLLGFFKPNTSLPLNFGLRPFGVAPRFAGIMDEISFYSRALPQEQIASIVNAGASGKSPATLWARETAGMISLTWLSIATNAVLETTPALTSQTWTPVGGAPTSFRGNTRLRLDLPVANTAQFFRLNNQL